MHLCSILSIYAQSHHRFCITNFLTNVSNINLSFCCNWCSDRSTSPFSLTDLVCLSHWVGNQFTLPQVVFQEVQDPTSAGIPNEQDWHETFNSVAVRWAPLSTGFYFLFGVLARCETDFSFAYYLSNLCVSFYLLVRRFETKWRSSIFFLFTWVFRHMIRYIQRHLENWLKWGLSHLLKSSKSSNDDISMKCWFYSVLKSNRLAIEVLYFHHYWSISECILTTTHNKLHHHNWLPTYKYRTHHKYNNIFTFIWVNLNWNIF